MSKLLILAAFVAGCAAMEGDHASHPGYFTWMTPYDTSNHTDWADMFKDMRPRCQLSRIHFIARHGTRSPSTGQMGRIRKIVDYLKASKGLTRLGKKLSKWTSQQQGGQILMERGVAEHEWLADDYLALLRHFNLTSGNVTFQSTDTQRTQASSAAFRGKLVNATAGDNFVIGQNQLDDERLHFFDKCERYVTQINKNISSRPEMAELVDGELVKASVRRVNERIFNRIVDDDPRLLTWDNVTNLYYMAGYETAINGSSIFTEVFDEEDLALQEFYDDMDTYLKRSGYNYPLSTMAACGLTNEIVDPKLTQGSVATFEFAHSETVMPLYAAFGVLRDKPSAFSGDATMAQIKSRNFKSSYHSTFATNMGFLIFDDCSCDPFYSQQIAIVVNGRLELAPTSLAALLNNLPSWVEKCNAEQICSMAGCENKFEPDVEICDTQATAGN